MHAALHTGNREKHGSLEPLIDVGARLDENSRDPMFGVAVTRRALLRESAICNALWFAPFFRARGILFLYRMQFDLFEDCDFHSTYIEI